MAEFYDTNGLVLLTGNIENDLKLIIDTIASDAYTVKRSAILQNKQRIINQYAFEPRVLSIIQMTYAKCYCLTNSVRDQLDEQGFKNITVLEKDIDLASLVCQGLQNFVPVLIITQDHVPKLLFDKLCFAFSSNPDTHAYTLEPLNESNINACFMPSGVEIMYVNAQKKQPILESLKARMIYAS